MKGEILALLEKNSDFFAWAASDMLGIDPKFMCHQLTMFLGAHPVA